MTQPTRLEVVWRAEPDDDAEELLLDALEILLFGSTHVSPAVQLTKGSQPADKQGMAR